MPTPEEEEADAPEEEESATPEDFVPLLECAIPMRADFYASLLEGHGIPVFVNSEHANYALPLLSNISRGIQINVLEEDLEEALELLYGHPEIEDALLEDDLASDFEQMEEGEDSDPGAGPEAHAEEEAPQACPNCASANLGKVQLPTWFRVLTTILLLGLPLLNSDNRPRWICLDCEWEWRE